MNGRASARAQADDGVVLADRERLDPGGSSVAVVLRLLLDRGALAGAARDERDDEAGWDAERRLALGCVDGRETPGRARADVDEAPSLGQPLHDGVDGCRDGAWAAPTAAGTRASSSFMSATSSAVERRSRSAPAAFHASVASSSRSAASGVARRVTCPV